MKTMTQSHACGKFNPASVAILAVAAFLASLVTPAQAGNILVNPSFEANTGEKIPTGWTFFEDPTVPVKTADYWIEGNETVPTGGHSGSNYWKEWGAGYFPNSNNVAGIYQDFGSAPSNIYQASGWFYNATSGSESLSPGCYTWIDVSFLDGTGQLLALYKSANYSASVGQDAWFQFQVTNACDINSPVSTGDNYYPTYAITGSVTQLVAPPGTKTVRYRFNFLQDDGDQGSCYFDDADLDQESGLSAPVISNMFPVNMIFAPPSNGLSFDVVASSSPINSNAIHLVLNGVDVSSGLKISGSNAEWTVLYSGLRSNSVYNAFITATDTSDLSVSATNYFETTWVGIPPVLYLWEAEDFDFNSGQYIDYPELCNAPGDANCYFGQVGVPGVDENPDYQGTAHLYRANDAICTDVSGDYLRANLYQAGRRDYEINPFDSSEWVNYTRDFTNGTYWIIGRIATDVGLSGTISMSILNPDSSTTPLGTFAITNGGLGWTTFENLFLLDGNGNKVNVTLNGKTTLQVTSGGNLLPNFFALVQATVDQPILSGLYPNSAQPYEETNSLTFNVASDGATFPAGGINVNLDGVDVTSALSIIGPGSNKFVVFPSLQENAVHTAIISVTNSLGHGFLITNEFDTFSTNNYAVEAEDFDYNGGQFITPWTPDAYEGLDSTTNIDFQHTTLTGEQYPYRPNGIPQQLTGDAPRAIFFDNDEPDYDLSYFGIGDWANYTRDYPTGSFYVYVRTSGRGDFSMTLDKVVSGAGTVNQVIQPLGHWNGTSDLTYKWVELTDGASSAPVVVNLNGVSTLRISTSTGDCYPNYFMLVPAAGVNVSAARQGNSVTISFPSVSGAIYRILSQSNLNTNGWSLVTSVLGNSGVTSATVPVQGAAQFYKVVSP